MSEFTIGEVARQTGATVETIRYYEKKSLIPPPHRSASGYRQYSVETVKRVRFIRRAKELGFSLSDIGSLLEFRDTSNISCARVKEQVVDKIGVIDQKIDCLRRMRGVLAELAGRCDAGADIRNCPILEALGENENGGSDSR
jgi:MerR family transcriptional regulator, copper efflux regulator